jgi:hypothetical protein
MNTPEWLKPGIYGAVAGALVVGIVGFSWGGWVTGGTAHDRATAMSHDDVVAAMVPVCLEKAQNDPDRTAKLTVIRDARTYQRRQALMETGWATMPGAENPDRDIAQACLASLDVEAKE